MSFPIKICIECQELKNSLKTPSSIKANLFGVFGNLLFFSGIVAFFILENKLHGVVKFIPLFLTIFVAIPLIIIANRTEKNSKDAREKKGFALRKELFKKYGHTYQPIHFEYYEGKVYFSCDNEEYANTFHLINSDWEKWVRSY